MLGMVLLSEAAFADWKNRRKNTRICASWRWYARSTVKYICVAKDDETQVNRRCNGTAQAYSRVGALGGSRAEAQAWTSSSSSTGWAFTNVPCLLPGYDPNSLFQQNLLNADDYNNSFGSQYINTDMDFLYANDNENYAYTVNASSISGYMLLKNTASTDYYSVYDMIISKESIHTNEGDDEINPLDIVWRSTITLTRDGVIGTGIFESNENYSIHETDSGKVLLFHLAQNLQVELNKNLSEGYIITTRGHIGYNSNNNQWVAATTKGLMNQLEQNLLTENHLKELTIYPNPSTKELNIELITLTDERVEIEIYDSRGQLVNKVFSGDTKKEEKVTITSDLLKDSPKGIYQMKYKIGDKSFVRQVIKD